MRKFFLIVLTIGLGVRAAAGADTVKEKKVQFAITASGLWAENEIKSDLSLVGFGGRIDFNLGKWFMLSPEISYFTGENGGPSAGGTVNFRFGGGYIGLGFIALRQSSAIEFVESSEPLNAFWKIHFGFKGRHWLIALSYVADSFTDSWLSGFGLTAGYVF